MTERESRASTALATWVWRMVAIALAGLGGALTAGLATAAQPVEYQTSVTLVAKGARSTDGSETIGRSVVALVTSRAVADDLSKTVPTELTPAQIQANIEAERPPGSSVINVSYTDTDQARANAMIRALPKVFVDRLDRLGTQDPKRPRRFRCGRRAGAARSHRASCARNAFIGGVLGAGLALATIVLLSARIPQRSTSGVVSE